MNKRKKREWGGGREKRAKHSDGQLLAKQCTKEENYSSLDARIPTILSELEFVNSSGGYYTANHRVAISFSHYTRQSVPYPGGVWTDQVSSRHLLKNHGCRGIQKNNPLLKQVESTEN